MGHTMKTFAPTSGALREGPAAGDTFALMRLPPLANGRACLAIKKWRSALLDRPRHRYDIGRQHGSPAFFATRNDQSPDPLRIGIVQAEQQSFHAIPDRQVA
jgi:hypothetical protein